MEKWEYRGLKWYKIKVEENKMLIYKCCSIKVEG